MNASPENSEINDVRLQKDFRNMTFSGFNKSQVKKELLNNLVNSKIEPSIYWTAEFICAGHFNDLWEIILYFYSYHIHIGNPKLSIYIDLRFQQFKEMVKSGYVNNEIRMRNHSKIRKLFSEIICILCYSKRKHSFEDIKIKSNQFDLSQLIDTFKAPDISFACEIMLQEDPKEIFIAVNELAFHLSNKGKNSLNACYWIEWLLNYELACKNSKQVLDCARREKMPIDGKFQKEVVWIIWSIFLREAENRHKLIVKIIHSLLNLFTLKYMGANTSRKRKYILYFVVELLVENVSLEEEIIKERDKEQLASILGKIDVIYMQIKENEHSPNTDYLFLNKKTDNLDKTIKRIEAMNAFGETFIPRTGS